MTVGWFQTVYVDYWVQSRGGLRDGSLECWAFIQFDLFYRSKIINFFQNHWCLILPADLCQSIWGHIQLNQWTAHFPPMSDAGMELDHCSYQTALDIQHLMSTSQEVKLVTDYHLQLLLCANQFPVACLAQARRSWILFPANYSQYTTDASHKHDTSTLQPILLHQPILSHLQIKKGWVVVCASRTQMKGVKNEAKAEVADTAALTMEYNK